MFYHISGLYDDWQICFTLFYLMIYHMFIRSIWFLPIFHHIYQVTINWTPPYLPDFTRFFYNHIYQIFIWFFTINWRPMVLPFFGTSRVQRGFEGPCLSRGAVGEFRIRQLCFWRSVESVADVSMNGTLVGYIIYI